MAVGKAKAPNTESGAPVAPTRTSSHTRFKSPLGNGPSTLPPPPFASEAEVTGLEWWLDAHMALASELLWLDQSLDGSPERGPHTETIRRLVAEVEGVRDALYALYCDAADPRMRSLARSGSLLEKQVRGSYAWCSRVAALLGTIMNGLRSGSSPDWRAAKAGFRVVAEAYVGPAKALREAVRALPIDFTSPVEPLRNLPQDLEQLFTQASDLQGTLAKRFG